MFLHVYKLVTKIKRTSHICEGPCYFCLVQTNIFLPKFHCELNPIEYFWAMIKKYLHDHCNYSFNRLKENLLKALDSVPIQTICWWEHQLFCWVDAYWAGLGSVEAQSQVNKFSSRQYKSHR